jgi:pyruvate,water dikinase
VIGEVGQRIVSHKEIEYRLTGADRVEQAPVDAARQDIPSLTDDEIKAVAALARQAEKHYGCPQDVEWAVEDGPSGAGAPAAVLLQSRPETVWSRKPPRRAAAAGGGYMASIVSTLVAPLHAGRGAGDDH